MSSREKQFVSDYFTLYGSLWKHVINKHLELIRYICLGIGIQIKNQVTTDVNINSASPERELQPPFVKGSP